MRKAFSKNTFIYGANLNTYKRCVFEQQEHEGQTTIEKIGTVHTAIFTELKDCLSASKMVKNKFRRMLQG